MNATDYANQARNAQNNAGCIREGFTGWATVAKLEESMDMPVSGDHLTIYS